MRRLLKRTLAALAAGILLFSLFLSIQSYTGNFHAVIPGEFYRSAQLEEGDITRYQQEYGIKTVLNLRGANKGKDWYDSEINEAKARGINHLDFRMSSSRELTKEEAIQLIAMMKNAPKPLLIHCLAGSDRTGLASALYVAGVAKGTEWEAERQMWIYYGHLPFYINASFAMNRTFERLEPYLGFKDS